MALHTEIDFDIGVYSTSAKENCHFQHQVNQKILDNFDRESSTRLKLGASASDQAVDLQSLTDGQLVVIVCSATDGVQVKFNGTGNPAFLVKPKTNTGSSVVTPGFLAMLVEGITSIHLSNPASSEIDVDIAVAGV